MLARVILVCGLFLVARGSSSNDIPGEFLFGTFPDDFVWGVSSSAYQTEGASNITGKGESIWDTFTHSTGHVIDDRNGDVAADSYHKLDADVAAIKSLGVSHYQFSLSWSRLLPKGVEREIPGDSAVLAYYHHVIDKLLDAGVQPMVTLYHWNLPRALQEVGGWLNSSNVAHFRNYANLCFREFGDKVKFWVTIHDPHAILTSGYWNGKRAPGLQGYNASMLRKVKDNLMTSHHEVYQLYESQYRSSQKGQIGMTLSSNWYEPREPSLPDDVTAASASLDSRIGSYVKDILQNGTADFLGVAYVTTRLSSRLSKDKCHAHSSPLLDPSVQETSDPDWVRSSLSDINDVPWGLQKLINWLKTSTSGLPIYVMGNGVPTGGATSAVDTERVTWYRGHINALLKAITIDNCTNVRGFFAYSLLDSFEWENGYTVEYGLFDVNFASSNLPRTPKTSAYFLMQVVRDNGFTKGYNMVGGMSTGNVGYENTTYYGRFPDGFRWGASTSAYQIEGAWNEDGRGATFLDMISRAHKGAIIDNSTGDSYHKFTDDIRILKETKVNTYRFSISWGRIFPNGTNHVVNRKGVSYYNKVIDGLLAAGIEPMVTIYKYDMPMDLISDGGWTNTSTIEHFKAFARVCFEEFGDRVKTWFTINEPYLMSQFVYSDDASTGTLDYLAAHNMILAHAETYHMYQTDFRPSQNGNVSIVFYSEWMEPKTPGNPEDMLASEQAMEFNVGWFAEPIFGSGDYPAVMKRRVAEESKKQHLNTSRLPEFTDAERAKIKGTYDFFSMNIYRTALVTLGNPSDLRQGFDRDAGFVLSVDPAWKEICGGRMYVTHLGMRKMLNWIRRKYGDIPILITENGACNHHDGTEDKDRIDFLKNYINEVLKAIRLDHVDVRGYTAWSLMDNFEWSRGYTERFGLHYINFSDPTRHRTPKASAGYYRQLMEDNGVLASRPEEDTFYYGTFPAKFAWSAATASYQVEGGWNEDGKGPSIWDTFSHQGKVDNNATGDVACDSYHRYLEDVQLLKNMKVTHYRFSISWPRILPDGTTRHVNQAGVRYYNQLIDALLDAGITPMITLYHWDLPQALQDWGGGWLNATSADLFADYARMCFREFGDRVKIWITLNEPWVVALQGYGQGYKAPGIVSPGDKVYIAAHNLIRAHGKAYRVYQEEFKKSQNGKVGITCNCDWEIPKDDKVPADRDAAERALQFHLGWFANPILNNGDYPEVMKSQIQAKSSLQHLPQSRLPEFTQEEKHYLEGSADFLGLNFYTSNLAEYYQDPNVTRDYYSDMDVKLTKDPSWLGSGSSWLKVTPFGIRRMLNWIKNQYGEVPVYVTENGISDRNGSLADDHRIFYYKHYINQVLKGDIMTSVTCGAGNAHSSGTPGLAFGFCEAIRLDHVDVRGYTAWSLMDNFEWSRGYTERFGLHYINFSDPTRHRTPKASAGYYRQLIQNNGFFKETLHPLILPGRGPLPQEDDFIHGLFPVGFAWSAATAAYQIEGGWNADGKGPSIWDTLSHQGKVDNNATGDVACDSYHKYPEDVQLLRNMKVTHYRFSISWPRILPDGTTRYVNQAGIRYYNRLINALLEAGITPMITLYHWDLPQALQDWGGGWLNATSADLFADYARLCFQEFGDRVKFWITLNEPWVVSVRGYGEGGMVPGIVGTGDKVYTTAHNLIRAHGKAYRVYQDEFKKTQNGTIGITLNCHWTVPKNPTRQADVDASDRSLQFTMGWFANALVHNGDYPDVMKWQVGNKSQIQNLTHSRLPEFTTEEKHYLKGSTDFLGLNFYTSEVIQHYVNPSTPRDYYSDMDIKLSQDPSWLGSGSDWLKVTPSGIRRMLNWMKEQYTDVAIYITENGVSDRNGSLLDEHRIFYYKHYLNQVLKAISLDHVDVRGYTAWSLMDNLEWVRGYTERFGLHYVDFNDPARPRTPKASAGYYRQVIEDNGFIPPPSEEDNLYYDTFPDGFAWSAATASYQVEGGWNEDGKGPSIWDTFSHQGKVDNNATGDVACDSYHKYLEDVQLLKNMKVTHYRFSISWPRILPDGTTRHVKQAGVRYYNQLIDALLDAEITPMITLYHWDLPQALQDWGGGWLNATSADLFADYARLCFREFGDRVKIWITLNEPWVVALQGYGQGYKAPGIVSPGDKVYIAAHNLIRAHGKAYRVYQQEFKHSQKGKVGITCNCDWEIPKNDKNHADIMAAERALQFHLGWFANPILINGDYPDVMKSQIRQKSVLQNLQQSRLPTFTSDEKQYIKGSADFLGLNFYTSNLAEYYRDPNNTRDYYSDMDIKLTKDPSWLGSGSSWLKVTPFGIRRMLNWIKQEYGEVPVYVTENGISDRNGSLADDHRIFYYKHYINELLKAIRLDHVDVRGYTAWSLMDNFEWSRGYTERFGLHYVNFSDPTRHRTPKASAGYYRQLIQGNGFFKQKPTELITLPDWRPLPQEDKLLYGTFPDGFAWSAATAAYQVEGGWNADGKGPSIWDTFSHQGKVDNNATGDVACDSYHRYLEDVQLLKNMKVTHYRFSISWPRILPDGTTRHVNQAGVRYYNQLIDALLDAGITPMITLYHWDLPQTLQDWGGGWLNATSADLFADYARLCFKEFGDRVKIWITLNEPWVVALQGYGQGYKAPGIVSPGDKVYIAAHNLIRAHGKAYRLYQDEFKKSQKGKVGITCNSDWEVPKSEEVRADREAADRAIQFHLGWFANPILNNGDYPDVMKWQIGNKSQLQNLTHSRLPEFTREEKDSIKGAADFLGLNFYTSNIAEYYEDPNVARDYYSDMDVKLTKDPSWLGSGSSWLKVTPFGIRRMLNWVKSHYGDVPVYLTENGISDRNGSLSDEHRIFYYKHYINELLKAIRLDHVDVRGYTAWSLMDNFEWSRGYTERFGLHHVDFTDPERSRTPKASAGNYRQLIQDNGFINPTETKPNTGGGVGMVQNRTLPQETDFLHDQFPKEFAWGTSTSAYEIEGAWNKDGKGPSIWDVFTHTGKVLNNDTGDVACDSYDNFHDDVTMLQNLKVSHYRFSISWSRVLPTGTMDMVNKAGLDYYDRLINATVQAGITPVVTLYHWDLPENLQQAGGWLNSSVIQHFAQFADLCFCRFGDRVKMWITFSNPFSIAIKGYGLGMHAPGLRGKNVYKVAHNILLAHATAYGKYDRRYRPYQRGNVGISLTSPWAEPRSRSKSEDLDASERALQYMFGWFAKPIFLDGDYPEVMKSSINGLHGYRQEGGLPEFTSYEKIMLRGSADFLGLNFFTSALVSHTQGGRTNTIKYFSDMNVDLTTDPSWSTNGAAHVPWTPWGLRKMLNWVHQTYPTTHIYVTENGVADITDSLADDNRRDYIRRHTNEVLKAIRLDHCDVIRGYFVWSLMDNFDWENGYSLRYGLYHVDYKKPERPRTAKRSASFYTELITNNGFHTSTPQTTRVVPVHKHVSNGVSQHVQEFGLVLTIFMLLRFFYLCQVCE